VALDTDGDFVVTWSGQDGGNRGVFGRLFDSSGSPVAGEFQINTNTTGDQAYPRVAVAPGGSFVVVWRSKENVYSASYGMVQRFDSAGSKLGVELKISAGTNQYYPAIDIVNSGEYVVVWAEIAATADVFGSRFDASGVQLASEFQVNVVTASTQAAAYPAIDGDGDFVVVWRSLGQDGDNGGIFVRRFASSGQAVGGEIQVNTYVTGNQLQGRIAMRSAGDFVVTWSSPRDGDTNGVFARRFNASGAALGGEFQVNVHTLASQTQGYPMMDQGGGFVAWHDNSGIDGQNFGVFARRFGSTGIPQSPDFQVNTYTLGYQGSPAAAMIGSGNFVVAWKSIGQDGDIDGIFAQRFLLHTGPYDVDGNGISEPLTDGLVMLRYLFGFRGAVLVNGAVGAGCTRCDAPTIEAFIAANV
jgi:hypothetical protein